MTKQELKQKANKLPELPGVYIMKDNVGAIIYIGKSKSLKSRVKTYFGNGKIDRKKIQKLIHHITDFEYILTDTELDALLLECKMIKEHQPIYNTLLKNDKKYRFLKLSTKSITGITVAYEKEDDGDIYFGPFDLKHLLVDVSVAINRFYGIPMCKQVKNINDCLDYKLGYCLGVCSREVNALEIDKYIEKVTHFLSGKDDQIIAFYEEKMANASLEFEFEKAALYRDYIKMLKRLGVKRESMSFAQANKRSILVVARPTGGSKVYHLEGTQILETSVVNEEIELEKIKKQNKVFLNTPIKERKILEKSEVDAIQIVYNYIFFKDNIAHIS